MSVEENIFGWKGEVKGRELSKFGLVHKQVESRASQTL